MRISAHDVGFRIGPKVILDRVRLTLHPGELVGLIGPNGAGKSTLLHLLASLRQPSTGQVRYDDRPAGRWRRRAIARRIAFLAQSGEVSPPMRVERLVSLGRLPHRSMMGGPSRADRDAVENAMARADVLAFRDRAVGTLSGGERRRVLLARALAVEADSLLADEPIAELDPRHQLQVMELLRQAARDGRSVVVVLHDLTLAARFCDRLVLLDRGRVVAEGSHACVLDDAHVARAFGITLVRAAQDNAPVVVPWARLGNDGQSGERVGGTS
ncbi:ABC transporter ATP-binding protein [Marinivivus vitaminiproducens]|uniref:ABC transporter ATP-binding protein n=1 Tax=Marinivivus vitaminiproducens TaxID=3035935 RepID=UPI00279FDF30|nr:ABC transporter ATP-binding protein [Geminicoccaceae bacterium SCSIO 64248]